MMRNCFLNCCVVIDKVKRTLAPVLLSIREKTYFVFFCASFRQMPESACAVAITVLLPHGQMLKQVQHDLLYSA